MTKQRSAQEGGYSRGDETRARIITSAIKVFGEQGYEGASTRDVAASAAVNPPAIQYYFDNKEGLYLVCLQQAMESLWDKLHEAFGQAKAALTEAVDDDHLIDALLSVQAAIIALIHDDARIVAWRQFLNRHQDDLCPASAVALFQSEFKAPLSEVIQALVARVCGLPRDDERVTIHAFSLFSHGLAFRAQRTGMLIALGLTAVDLRTMESIREVALMHGRYILEGLAQAKRNGAAAVASPR